MPHRRLVQLCALTVMLALLALIAVTAPTPAPLSIRAQLTAVDRPALPAYSGPAREVAVQRLTDGIAVAAWTEGAERLAASDAFYAEVQRQIDAAATVAAAAKSSARPGTRTEPSPALPPDGSVVDDAIAQAFGSLFASARRVAHCESTLDPNAVSPGGGNYGLFQINHVHSGDFEQVTGRPWSDVFDPYANSTYAKYLYDSSGGWGPWACRWAA